MSAGKSSKGPTELAEVFGFPINNVGPQASQQRMKHICPFNNGVPNCTKVSATDPLGVCSITHKGEPVVVCPIRFRQHWTIIDEAARFFFPPGSKWARLTEVPLRDNTVRRAGNIDIVLVSFDARGELTDFGAIEVQSVYISGTIKPAFKRYMDDPRKYLTNPQRPLFHLDYLSSSRKRLLPQLMYKGAILKSWGKKLAVVLDESFTATLPKMEAVDPAQADIAWLVYRLRPGDDRGPYLTKLYKKNLYEVRLGARTDQHAKPWPYSRIRINPKSQTSLDRETLGTPNQLGGAV